MSEGMPLLTPEIKAKIAKAQGQEQGPEQPMTPEVKAKVEKAIKTLLTDPGIADIKLVGPIKVTILLPTVLAARILKPPTGSGGWQTTMAEIRACVTVQEGKAGVIYWLNLPAGLYDKLVTLSVKHGSGGYQGLIRHILCLTLAQK